MNDDVQPPDTPSDELLAVSAALDGVATPDELALIEASPDLSGLLDDFQTNRQLLMQAGDPPAQAREAGIAAALAAFDELHESTGGTSVPAHSATVVSLDRRRRWYRVVTAAAAALVLVIVGAAALGSFGGSSDDASTADVSVSQKSGGQAETAAVPPAAEDASPMAAADSAASIPPETDAPDLSSTQINAAPDATSAPSATDAPSGTPVPTIGEIPGPGDVLTEINNVDELASYAAAATADRDAASDRCVPVDDDYLGEISYQGTPALVGRDPDTGTVTAYRTTDCTVLATVAS